MTKSVLNMIHAHDDFDLHIERKRIKNLYVRVSNDDGCVKVSAPLRTSLKDIHAFVSANRDWIYKQRQAAQSARRFNHIHKHFVDGETCYFFGVPHQLKVVVSEHRECVEQIDHLIILRVAGKSSQVKRAQLLDAWYRQQLQQAIWQLVAQYQPEMGVCVREVKIRKMKTRWGSCNPSAARICLNLDLVYWPITCLETVVVHEMVHFLELSHNHRFKQLMTQFLPDWKERGKQLRAGFFE